MGDSTTRFPAGLSEAEEAPGPAVAAAAGALAWAALLAADAVLPAGSGGALFALLAAAGARSGGGRAAWAAAVAAAAGVAVGGALHLDDVALPVLLWGRAAALVAVGAALRLRLALLARGAERPASGATERREVQLAIDAAPLALIAVDPSGGITHANRGAREIFGYSEAEMVGMNVDLLVPAATRAEHARNREAYAARPEKRSMGGGRDLRAVRKDGSEVPVEVGLNPVRTEQGLVVLSAIVDITERKRIERKLELGVAELKRSNEELEDFARLASHDLKAPLRAIGLLATWIEEDADRDLSPATREHLVALRRRVARMDRLLSDLLEYARAGRGDEGATDVDLRALVRGIADAFGPPPGFRIEAAPDLPRLSTARPPLEHVLRNLIDNAIKHHDRGGGRILVSARMPPEGVLEVCVSDDGPGIPEEFRERVFDVFHTLRPRDEVEGSGLGLSLIKKVVERRGGTVRIEANGERGTRVAFTWPSAGG